MNDPVFPDDLLERNQAWASRRTSTPLPAPEPVPLAVVTCFDPRLDPLLRPALGLGEGEGFLFRTAGAIVAPDSATLRNVALAVLMFGVRRLLVLGHSSCRMAAFETNEFIDTFRARGVAREAFGDQDLRSWAGAIATPRQGVRESAAVLAAAPFLPEDLEIAGGVLDDSTGKIELVLRPGEAATVSLADSTRKDDGLRGAPRRLAAADDVPIASPWPVAESPPELPRGPLPPAAEAIQSTVDFLASQEHMRDRLELLRQGLEHERNPLRRVELIHQFVREGAADSPDLQIAFGKLTSELRDHVPELLSKVFIPLVRRKSP